MKLQDVIDFHSETSAHFHALYYKFNEFKSVARVYKETHEKHEAFVTILKLTKKQNEANTKTI